MTTAVVPSRDVDTAADVTAGDSGRPWPTAQKPPVAPVAGDSRLRATTCNDPGDVEASRGQRAPAAAVEEVRPGVWCLPQPIPGPLGHVLVYALEAEDGIVLVDAGWDAPQSLEYLDRSLHGLGARLTDVRGVLFTHSHFDHYGLAARVREESGAWLALHEVESAPIDVASPRAPDEYDAWFAAAGVGAAERAELVANELLLRRYSPTAKPDRRLLDGDRLLVGALELEVLHTPGHSPGHLCFVAAEHGIVFCGDHVLSETTPNVSAFVGAPPSPLDDYLRSLERVRPYDDMLALPGHESPGPIAPRAAELIRHHELQLEAATGLVRDGARTVREIAAGMPWSAPWAGLRPLDVRLALAETLAHLLVLEGRGVLVHSDGAPVVWSLDESAGVPSA